MHSALSLVATLFGVAVLFIAQDADFLAAVQVIVYAGAIVVLFLFVIMLLGVDQADDLAHRAAGGPARRGRRSAGLGLLVVAGAGLRRRVTSTASPGPSPQRRPSWPAACPTSTRSVASSSPTYVFAFEITVGLLIIAVIGAVVLARATQLV